MRDKTAFAVGLILFFTTPTISAFSYQDGHYIVGTAIAITWLILFYFQLQWYKSEVHLPDPPMDLDGTTKITDKTK